VGLGGGRPDCDGSAGHHIPPPMWHAFIFFLLTLPIRLLRAACKPRDELVLENLALRQQVAALMLATRRPTLHDANRAFWVALHKT